MRGPRSTLAGVGSFHLGDEVEPDGDSSGVGPKKPAAKSSTTKGPEKGLPVTLVGDGAELRKVLAEGKGSFLFRTPKACARSARGECSRGGPWFARQRTLRVTPCSDVTDRRKTTTNRGRSQAAEVMLGAGPCQPRGSNAGLWESAPSRTGRKSAVLVRKLTTRKSLRAQARTARQSWPVRCAGVVPGARSGNERSDGGGELLKPGDG